MEFAQRSAPKFGIDRFTAHVENFFRPRVLNWAWASFGVARFKLLRGSRHPHRRACAGWGLKLLCSARKRAKHVTSLQNTRYFFARQNLQSQH
jgi:hypothetical protein